MRLTKHVQGDVVPANHVIRVRRRHIFKKDWPTLMLTESLWVSGQIHESGFRKSHAENRGKYKPLYTGSVVLTMPGAEHLGTILVDLTPLQAQRDKYLKTYDNYLGFPHTFWDIEFDLCLIIDGRNLRFEARSPEDPNEVKESKSFSIAASFAPGTA